MAIPPPDGISGKSPRKPLPRAANLDLFRILAMLLIITIHSLDESGILEITFPPDNYMFWYIRFIRIFSRIGVNCFVLISGYFLVTSSFKLKKLAALWLEVVFYAFTVKLLFMLIGKIPFSVFSLVSCFFPVFTGRYWFVTIYFGMYLLSPFLNSFIRALDKKQHLSLCIILFVLFSVLISIHPRFAGINSGGGWGLLWFIVLYITAAWIRLYYKPNGRFALKLSVWLAASILITLGYFVGNNYLPPINTILDNFVRYDSVPVFLMSISVFLAFINIRIPDIFSRPISFIAGKTFGIYLLHHHADMNNFIWEKIDLPAYSASLLFPFIEFASVIGIFLFCLAVDIVRRYTVGKLETSNPILKICDTATDILHNLLGKIEEKI